MVSFGNKFNMFAAPQAVERPIPFAGVASVKPRAAEGVSAQGIPASAFASLSEKYSAQPLDPPKMAGVGTSFMQAGALGNEGAVACNNFGKKGMAGAGLNLLG